MASKRNAKAFWERAYKGHAYWRGKTRLGKVSLERDAAARYRWEAAGRAGYAEALAKAKAAVEMAVWSADRQLDLFTS